MLISLTSSKFAILEAIWTLSCGFGISSFVVLCILLFNRKRSEQLAERRDERKKKIARCLFSALKSPVAILGSDLLALSKQDTKILILLALDLLRSVRGADTEKVIEILNVWGARKAIIAMTAHSNKHRRIQALTLLGYFSDEDSLLTLLKHVSDVDIYAQLAALRSLAQRGATNHLYSIASDLAKSKQTNVLLLSDVLQRFGVQAVQTLIELGRNGEHSVVRMAAVMALGNVGCHSSVAELVDMSATGDVSVRAEAITALGKIGDSRATAPILQYLHEPSVEIRIRAVEALGRLRHNSALEALANQTNDTDWWVRFKAAQALYTFGDRGILVLDLLSKGEGLSGLITRQVLAESKVLA